MSYLSQPTTTSSFGVVQIGSNIDVVDGIISVPQYLSSTSSVVFAEVNVTGELLSYGQQVVTSVSPDAGPGISLTNVVSTGTATSFTINNTGVLSVTAGSGVSISTSTGNITISATGADLIAVYGTSTNYTATGDDEYIGVSSVAPVTISLPTGIPGRVYTIKDEYGQGSGKITVSPVVGELIDGKINYIISVPYQSISTVFRAGQWRII